MKIKSANDKVRAIPEQGTHVGRCISIIDLGTQHWEYLGNQQSGHKVRITWELPEATDSVTGKLPSFEKEGKFLPFVVSEEYTVSVSPKSNLRPVLEGWLGRKLTTAEEKDLDLNTFLNKECLLNIVHNPSKKDASIIYANIGGVSQIMKGMTCPPAVNPVFSFDIDQANAKEVFSTLHDFLKKKIEESDEWKAKYAKV